MYRLHRYTNVSSLTPYITYRVGGSNRLMLGTNQGSSSVKAGYYGVSSGTATLTTSLPLPSGATYAAAVDGYHSTSGSDIVGYSNDSGQSAVGSMRWSYSSGFPGFTKILNGNIWDGRALRINSSSRISGYFENSSGEQLPYSQEGTAQSAALNTGGYSQGQNQTVSDTNLAMAGWLYNSGGSGYFALWTRPNQQSNFGSPTLVSTSKVGYVTGVFDGGSTNALVYGWSDTDSKPFKWTESDGVLTLLGGNGEMTSMQQAQRGYMAGTMSGDLPCVFIESDDSSAGTGIANDLNALLRPGEPEPSATTVVTGIGANGNFGGMDFGSSSDDNIWLTELDNDWLLSTYSSANIEVGSLVSGSNAAWCTGPDGKAMKVQKFIVPNPTSPIIAVRFEHEFTPTKPTIDLTFRMTTRMNTTGCVQHMDLYNYSTSSWDTDVRVDNLGTAMKTRDFTVSSNLSNYIQNYSGSGPWNVKGRIRIFQPTPGTTNPVIEIEQGRFIAADN